MTTQIWDNMGSSNGLVPDGTNPLPKLIQIIIYMRVISQELLQNLIHVLGVKFCSILRVLTHWGRDKMATIFQTTFSNAFLEWKFINFESDFTEVCSQGAN